MALFFQDTKYLSGTMTVTLRNFRDNCNIYVVYACRLCVLTNPMLSMLVTSSSLCKSMT